jgi:hypothetical protein
VIEYGLAIMLKVLIIDNGLRTAGQNLGEPLLTSQKWLVPYIVALQFN